MSMSFPVTLKSGFFKTQDCLMKIDHLTQEILLDCGNSASCYVIEFSSIKRIIYNALMHHELEIQTEHTSYIGVLKKTETQNGLKEVLQAYFGDQYIEIK